MRKRIEIGFLWLTPLRVPNISGSKPRPFSQIWHRVLPAAPAANIWSAPAMESGDATTLPSLIYFCNCFTKKMQHNWKFVKMLGLKEYGRPRKFVRRGLIATRSDETGLGQSPSKFCDTKSAFNHWIILKALKLILDAGDRNQSATHIVINATRLR